MKCKNTILNAVFFFLCGAAFAAEDPSATIVAQFSENHCDLVRKIALPNSLDSYRANILAILAYCEVPGIDSEKLFALATKKDPSGDLIMVLHAKYKWNHDHEQAKKDWEMVLKHARNPYLRWMAREYLQDNVDKEEPLHLSATTIQGRLKVGASYESNPIIPYDSKSATPDPQGVTNWHLNGGAQHWFRFGSTTFNYSVDYNRYFLNPKYNFLTNQFELPVGLRLGTYEDLLFRPFTEFSFVKNKSFERVYGIGILGVAYRDKFKQSAQASIFKNQLLFPSLNPQEGMHLRFDYNWEFFPSSWFFRLQNFVEHVKATHDFENGTDLKFSHTDFGAQFNMQNFLKGINYELEVIAMARIDNITSQFYNTQLHRQLEERRDDFRIRVKPSLTIPIFSYVQLNAWYQLDRTFSSSGQGDYADYNTVNHIMGLALQAEFSNY